MPTRQQIEVNLDILVSVVRNAACHRSLLEYKGSLGNNYWILVFNNFLEMAILDWCKVFGADSEKTHWRKIVNDHTSFRKGLLEKIGLDDGAWETYRVKLQNYRDKHISHHDKHPRLIPSLDIVLKSCYYYFEWLRCKLWSIHHVTFDPVDLSDYYNRFLKQATIISKDAYSSTKKKPIDDC